MDIQYQGGAWFVLNGSVRVDFNPASAVPGSVILETARKRAAKQRVSGPGEYEIGGALIVAVTAGPPAAPEMALAVDLDGINVMFAPAALRGLGERDLRAIGPVDVLILEAADSTAAHALIRELLPRVVAPFGPQAEAVAAAAGVKDTQPQARFAWNGVSAAPKAVLLKAANKRRAA